MMLRRGLESALRKEEVVGIWKREPEGTATARVSRAETPQPDFLTAGTQLRTSVGADSEVTGRLSFSAPTRIDGKLRGEVCASDLLVIGEAGRIEGTVRATQLVILGHVQGEVAGAERVEIGPRGRMTGKIETRALVVHEGGLLEADCRVAPPRAQVHFLDARRSQAREE